MKKRRICIIYTGGTIGMIPSERGYIPSSGAFRQLLRAIPDLYWDAMPEWDVVEFDPLLDSSDVAVREWNQMGRAIAERYDDYDGHDGLFGVRAGVHAGKSGEARHLHRRADPAGADPHRRARQHHQLHAHRGLGPGA